MGIGELPTFHDHGPIGFHPSNRTNPKNDHDITQALGARACPAQADSRKSPNPCYRRASAFPTTCRGSQCALPPSSPVGRLAKTGRLDQYPGFRAVGPDAHFIHDDRPACLVQARQEETARGARPQTAGKAKPGGGDDFRSFEHYMEHWRNPRPHKRGRFITHRTTLHNIHASIIDKINFTCGPIFTSPMVRNGNRYLCPD